MSNHLSWALVLVTLACSSKEDPKVAIGSKAPATSSNNTPAVLQDLIPDVESSASFDFTKQTEIVFSGSSKLVFAHPDGHSISYDAALKAWSSTLLSNNVGEYDVYYDFLDQGHLALKATEMSLRMYTGNTLIAVRPEGILNDSTLGFNPGYASSLTGTNLTTVRSDGKAAKIFRSATFLATMKQVYPCNSACALWAYDGSKVQILGSDGVWKDIALPIAIEPNLKRLVLYFNPDSKTPVIDSVLTVAANGKMSIFASVSAKAAPTWDDVKLISERFCVSCHLDDGFEKQETWNTLKSSMIGRLKLTAAEDGAMPPPETKLGKEMGAHDKSVLVNWLETISQTNQGTIGTGKDPAADAPISGDLKVLSDKYCLSCHSDAAHLVFWTGKQADIARRVGIANMPKNTVMTDAEKKKLLDLVNAL